MDAPPEGVSIWGGTVQTFIEFFLFGVFAFLLWGILGEL